MSVSDISFVYLLSHLSGRVLDFFRHWYWYGFLKALYWFYNVLERLDRIFALRITFKNWLQPLYQDYSIIGYLWGFIFRTARIFVALAVYAVFTAFSLALFLLWAIVPIFLIYKIITNAY